jgi:hypothetical protein
MAKITPADLTDMGFTKEMFNGVNDLELFLAKTITEQADLLADRIGSSKYNSSVASTVRQVTRTEKCLIVAELCKLRKVKLIGTALANGEEAKTSGLDKQITDYTNEAEALIGKITAGATIDAEDFSSGALVTDHFGGNNA